MKFRTIFTRIGAGTATLALQEWNEDLQWWRVISFKVIPYDQLPI